MEVHHVTGLADIKRFCAFSHIVYCNDPMWVPEDEAHITSILSGASPLSGDMDCQAMWVSSDGHILARLVVLVDRIYNTHWHGSHANDVFGHVIWFEALPEQIPAVKCLFSAAFEWFGARNCNLIRQGFLMGRQMPMTIDSYSILPTVFHCYNPAYYHSYMKSVGFKIDQGMAEYRLNLSSDLIRGLDKKIANAEKRGITFRTFDPDNLLEDTRIFTEIHNETFARHWGAMPSKTEIFKGLTVDLGNLFLTDLAVFALVDGKYAGMVLGVQDLNQALHGMRGRDIEDFPEEFKRLVDDIDHGILLYIGVREEFRGRRIAQTLGAYIYSAMAKRGFKTASYTLILDTNKASRKAAEKLGGIPQRNYVTYYRTLPRIHSTRVRASCSKTVK